MCRAMLLNPSVNAPGVPASISGRNAVRAEMTTVSYHIPICGHGDREDMRRLRHEMPDACPTV